MIINRRNVAGNSDTSVRSADHWNGCLFGTIGIRRICERRAIEFLCAFAATHNRQAGPAIERSIARDI